MAATVFFSSANELATLSNTFKVNGVATDPTAATLTVTSPSNVVTAYTWPAGPNLLTRTSAGVFTVDVTSDEEGDWQGEWSGTGTASDDTAVTWQVFPTSLGHLYATPDALKSRLRLTGTADDFEVHQACFAVSRWLETFCERIFYRTAAGTVRTFVPCDWYRLRLGEFNDLVSVSALATDSGGDGTFETTWLTSDYQLHPVNPSAAPETRPYTSIRAVGSQLFPVTYGHGLRHNTVQITGAWGWPQVPYGIRQAALILAEEAFKLKEVPIVGDFGVIRIRSNPAANAFAAPYAYNAKDDSGRPVFVA